MNALAVPSKPGIAGYYKAPYITNACGYKLSNATNFFAAIGDELWDDGRSCGQILEVTCVGATNEGVKHPCIEPRLKEQVTVIDHCIGCNGANVADFLLSEEAFRNSADIDAGSIKVEYELLD
ncbi:hypothetical protein HPP92_012065 [Vanilla planifolia]|uniref:Expansin-like EG45 domain-containing protein n=1 Tax=Vanilla planifolia TaxID=51239 RepID=A0A835R7R0_VANPL|nr:hypothetical protein HPP92_012435 [Vanilla planifolia]KAG0483981.1 hypothetical protein HPP92_012065 [Vanilla planifolia]